MAADPVVLIQATLAPIFLVNGAAIFLNFTQARLFRVIDRLRAIAKELKEEGDTGTLASERSRHLTRAVILRNAILFGVLVIGFTVATTLLILLPAEFENESVSRAPVYAFTGALVSFAVALVLVAADAFMSVAAARHIAKEFGSAK